MMVESKNGAIRFVEFTDEWQQRKLSNISNKVTEKNVLLVYDETFTNSAKFGIISQRDFFDHDISNEENIGGYYIVRNDDFVYNPRISSLAPVGPINRNRLGRPGVMSPLYIVFRTHDIDNPYLEQYFKSVYWHSFMRFSGDTGARSDRFSIKDSIFAEMPIPYPTIPEQKKIGALLENIDKLVAQSQQIYNKLKNLKNAMLGKLFPKDGTAVPEVRFERFSGAWEQRKLSELCIEFKDGDWIETKDQSNEGIRLIQTGNVGKTRYLDKPDSQKWISNDTFQRLHCKEILPGDILISRLPEPAGRACIIPDLANKMITAVDCTIVRTKTEVSTEYLVQYLSTDKYFSEVNVCLAGGTRQRISRSILSEFIVAIPKDDKEQKQIGQFFENLDNLIILQQREFKMLENIKKSMLERMFV